MSSYIHLDSWDRNRDQFPNPASFTVLPEQTKHWFHAPRTTKILQGSKKQDEYMTSVRLLELVIPYSTTNADLAQVYLDFHSREYADKGLVRCMDPILDDVRFVCGYPSIQYDHSGAALYIRFSSSMVQQMRINPKSELVFNVMDYTGATLANQDTGANADRTKQVIASFELISYYHDAKYDHQRSDAF